MTLASDPFLNTSPYPPLFPIIRAAELAGTTRIVPPPVNAFQREAALAAREAYDRDFSVTKQYAEAMVEVASTEGVPVVDVWSATRMYETGEGRAEAGGVFALGCI
jgi:hypothetical protein